MTKPLSPIQAQILTAAARHPDRLAEIPAGLPAAARNAVVQSMLKAGLLEEVPDPDSASPVLRMTAAGLETVRVEPRLPYAAGEAAASPVEGRAGQGNTAALPHTQEAPATAVPL